MLLEITAIFGFPSFRPTKRWIGAIPLHLGDAHLFAFSQDAQFRLQLLGKLPVIVFCVPPKGGGLQTGLPWESPILGFGNVSRQNTRSGPMTGFPSRALASPLFPTAPFQQPLSKFLRRSFSVPATQPVCSRPHLPPFFAEPKLLSVKHQSDTHLRGGNSHLPRS